MFTTYMNHIFERIETKKRDYQEYNFSAKENNALKTFFDLSQELVGLEDFYHLCVAIPKGFFNLDARLYLIDPKHDTLSLAAMTSGEQDELNSPPPHDIAPGDHPYMAGNDRLVLTIRGKEPLIEELPFEVTDDVLGLLVIYPVIDLNKHKKLFFEKYANRIGFKLHNKFLIQKNIEHLRFIKSLVADIEHNIIVPNMVYKLFLRGLRKKIEKNIAMGTSFKEKFVSGKCDSTCMQDFSEELTDINHGLTRELENIEKHYINMSLFIETLFRKSHFDQGRLTPRTKECNMKKDVIQPQLDRYIEQMKRMGITVDNKSSGIPESEIITVVDIGLVAQVYANLFSNVVKYTKEINTESGETRKYISYGHEIIKDYFGSGKDGVKFNVFSTGPHIAHDERDKLFNEEFRGSNVISQPGTGHGLSFIKNAIEIHGGTVGYEATHNGNNFFFILPK